MEINILSKYPHPKYATENSAGLDLQFLSPLQDELIIKPFDRILVPTGLFLEIPKGYYGAVCPRSGLAYNKGITVLNAPGIIDSDYRDEIKVILINLSDSIYSIKKGDRVAQILFHKYEKVELSPIYELNKTERTGGFGSTGV